MLQRIASFGGSLGRLFVGLVRRPMRRQTAALCWRHGEDGRIEILLVTTRNTKRWTPPRGWPMEGRSLAEAAAVEAWEEAGVVGEVEQAPLGEYRYDKGGAVGEVMVSVFALRVERMENKYRETGQRERRWMTRSEATQAIEQKALSAMIANFTR